MVKEVKIVDALEEIEIVKKKIRERVESLHGLIQKSGLPLREGSSFFNILEIVRGNRFPDLIPRGLLNVPVIKPEAVGKRTEYQKITEQWDLLGSAIKEYIELYAKTYYGPYLRAYEDLKNSLEEVKRREGLLFIHDINKGLSDYLNHEMIPDVYFRIGETIYHYLIDEFQDTSPIQWANLFPLIENSLSQGGSLFVVGDTKQAIYGFRNADYRIMRGLESENPFSSALHQVKELETNYRSLEEVVNFSKVFFKEVMANHDTYREPARRSGLLDYEQTVRQGHRGSGYVEIIRCEKNEDRPAEKEKIQELIKELIQRGYSRSDIAILAYRNEDVVNITTWLNEIGILFISYSSLDIRTRKLTAEIVALLTFLDSPPDDLSFAGFLLGDIFREVLERDNKAIQWKGLHDFFLRNRRKSPLYKAFQKEFPEIWEDYFGALFKSTGYLPLYDLVSQIYRIFAVFDHFEEEEATLVKILEVIKNFEGEGRNNPSDFLKRASDEETEEANWTLDVPAGIDAVRVMTLHKAKGLESPVTLVLLYEEHPRGFKYILDEEREGGALLKITQAIMKGSPFLQKRYEEERIKDLVNKINTLYVGFSRAQDELYIIGVEGKGNRLPLDLLQIMDSHSLGSKFGSKRTPRFHPPEMGQEVLKPYHHPDPIQFPFAPVAELNLDERLRGEFIHRVLYFVEELHEDIETELEGILHRVNEELKTDYPVGDMKAKLLEFLKHETIKPYFQARPGRVIKKEQGFSDSKGNLFRMDRVIFEADRVWVIDYKTGTDQEAEKEYVSQLKNYIRILNEIYSERNVEGVLAYVDLKEVKKVIRS
jgi:ATP-dependent exoDNAse (exonuclease V) beta subunit